MDAIRWTDWQVVHAAWTEGSFTGAAAVLGVGQATVSRRVAQVEEALGHVLFDRHRTGLVPTAAARRLRPHLEALSTAAHGAARAVEGLEELARGEVRVAGPPGLCVDWMPIVARRLAEVHPEVTLCVLADIEPRDLDRREADVALRLVPTRRGDLLVRRLLELRGGMYGTAVYRDSLGPDATVEELDIVHYSDDYAHIALDGYLRSLGARSVFRSNDYLVQRAAVVAGLGAGLMGDLEARVLGLVPLDVALPGELTSPLYLVVHRALRHVPRVAAVIEVIDELVEDLDPALRRPH